MYKNSSNGKKTEITLSPFSTLVSKTLFKFISQCCLVPYLESGLCKDGNELKHCDFTGVLPNNRLV